MTPRPLSALVLLTMVAGCARTEAPATDQAAAPAEPNRVTVTATDYAFAMPDTLPAGPTVFHLVNNSTQELHHVQLLRLDEGKTAADLQGIDMEGAPPSWLHFVGGPNTPRPGGGESEGAVDLVPGNYAVICAIPSPDGVVHAAKGMVKPLTVVPATTVAAMPEAHFTMTLNDYSFTLSSPLASGRHAIRVVNEAAQPHEVVFFRLAEGKRAADLLAWMDGGMQGPPPAEPVGGTSMIGQAGVNVITLDLTPGTYGLYCFFPAPDGKPHFAHGMMQELTIN